MLERLGRVRDPAQKFALISGLVSNYMDTPSDAKAVRLLDLTMNSFDRELQVTILDQVKNGTPDTQFMARVKKANKALFQRMADELFDFMTSLHQDGTRTV